MVTVLTHMILIVLEVAGIGFQHDWEESFHVVTQGKMTETETRITLILSKTFSW